MLENKGWVLPLIAVNPSPVLPSDGEWHGRNKGSGMLLGHQTCRVQLCDPEKAVMPLCASVVLFVNWVEWRCPLQ